MMKALGIATLAIPFLLLQPTPAAGHCGWEHHECEDGCWDCSPSHHARARQPQAQQQSQSPAPAQPSGRLEALDRLEGKIVEVIYLPGASASSAMAEVEVQSGAQTTLVRLAPTGFLKQKNLRLKEGDAVSITGYRVDAMEGDLLVATEVRKGTQTVTLRNDLGRSMW